MTFPKIIKGNHCTMRDYHIAVSDKHWIHIDDLLSCVRIRFRDESNSSESYLDVEIDKESSVFDNLINALLECHKNK